jgi:5-methylcytosine-specific restriction endonuclease McrA
MTPLFQHPDNYLFNLIAMTSPEAKRLWRRAIKEHFDQTCIYCGKSYDLSDLTLDHVHPRHHGGSNDTSNVVCACQKCNQEKGTLHWRDFMSHFNNPIREQLILNHTNG